MPSYVSPLVAMVVPVLGLLGAILAVRRGTSKRRWTTVAVLLGLIAGAMIAFDGRPAQGAAEEKAVVQSEQPQEGPAKRSDASEPEGAAESDANAGPESPETEPETAAEEEATAGAEQPAAREAKEEPSAAEAEEEAVTPEAASETEEPPADEAGAEAAGPRIESWLARSLFNFALLVVLLLVLIGPFWLGHRLTENRREPLLGWPIGLVLFCVAVVVTVVGLRWLFGLLPAAYLDQFNAYVDGLSGLWKLWATVLLIAVPMWLGTYLSRRWRMPDHSGKIAVVCFAVLAGSVITFLGWDDIRYGIDLRGGVILVYEYQELREEEGAGAKDDEAKAGGEDDQQADAAGQRVKVDMDKLIQAISRRVNPGGVKEVTIREYGNRQIEVIIPEADPEEVARIRKKISSAGTLEFRILANNRDHASLIEQAEQLEGRDLKDSEGTVLAWWVPVARGQEDSFASYTEIARRLRKRGDYEFTEILVVKDTFNVTGEYLRDSRPSVDESGRPNVLFTFNQRGGNLFGGLTGANLPEEGQEAFSRKLGIILDGYLQSAPAIRSMIYQRGEITGDFTAKEVEDLVDVLNAGSLPAALSEEPISELVTGPTLGRDTIQRGKYAIGISMLLVLVFMLYYYRFAGIVACMALLMNLVLILAVMISIKAAFTLPGLAGLVLTVGMAVDANVLIYERIREELSRQATLRMAIRNGFGRATTTIIDANLTTLITATVLYVIGTDQIKGFAVTLWVGIVTSMFTAIYCSRVVFDVADRQKWITRLKMLRMLGQTQIDFLGMRRVAAVFSITVILIGLGGVFYRGKGLLDIDFTGGVSVETLFQRPQRIADLRTRLGEEGEGLQDLAVSDVQTLEEAEAGLRFIINTSGPRDMPADLEPEKVLALVEEHIETAFEGELVHYSMEIDSGPARAKGPPAKARPARPADENAAGNELPDDSLLAAADPSASLLARAEEPSSAPEQEETPADESSPDAEAPGEAAAGEMHATLTFGYALTYETLKEMLDKEIAKQQQAGRLPKGTVDFDLSNEQYLTVDNEAPYLEWEVRLDLPLEQGNALLAGIKTELESQPYFPSSNTIGGKVAGQTRALAIMAVLASLVFIVGYIWIRFQRVMFGLAAVLALIHDILITLGVIALTAFLAPFLGFLLIDEFKIGLSVLAAFLTIIGYSLNDTIVVFDRIREVRGKAPKLTGEMINSSINQTLSRTLLTSLTTLIVVVILYVGGGQGIHVFSFALVVGVVVGTYSSIFVASPALFWMAEASSSPQRGRA